MKFFSASRKVGVALPCLVLSHLSGCFTGVVNLDDIAVCEMSGRTRVLQEALGKARVGLQ